LQEKWACLGNPSGKPSRPTHPGSRKLGFDHFVSKYNKISLKIRVLKSNSLQK
jgi:hypothetical protein